MMRIGFPPVSIAVKDYMCKDVLSVESEDVPLADVIREMAEHRIGSVVVVTPDRRVKGIVTERDIVRALARGVDLNRAKVGDIMTRDVVTINEGATLADALHIMLGRGIRHLPVVDSEGRLRGIISMRDIMRASLKLMVEILSYLVR